MLIAFNGTRENGNFCGDQLCYLKAAYLMVRNQPDVDRVIMTLSLGNEMDFLWTRFLRDPCGDETIPPVEVVYDSFNPGDWSARWYAWNKWRAEKTIEDKKFDHYRELYLRIHGAQRQTILCGSERGLGRRNIYEYVYYGQEHMPSTCVGSDIYDVEVDHPPLAPNRDVYISPHCKTQGNVTFTFDYWSQVVRKLLDAGITVTVGYNGHFCEELNGHPLYKKHWGDHKQWMEQICHHKLVACGNTGTGWLAAACGVPMITMEPHNSVMADHRYRECGLRNIVEIIDGNKLDDLGNDMSKVADYCARRIIDEVQRVVVMTTGCYDILHAGHVRHLERSRALGTRLVVALNSDESIRRIKGPERPINPQGQRKSVLEALRCVDEVQIFDGDNAIQLIEKTKPAVLTNGFGYTPDKVVGRELVESYGGRVVITCQGDASNEPSTTKIAQRLVRSGDIIEICRVGSAYSVNGFDKLKLMANELVKVAGLPGDIADLGAWRGGISLIMRRLAPDKQLFVFDTWKGTPYSDPLCHHKQGEWASPLEDCIKLVGDDLYTWYMPGTFPNTSAGLDHNYFCFVYVDMDTEQATRDAIEFFWPRLVRGGKLFVDDYDWEPCAGVKKAVDEMFPPEECNKYIHPDLGVPVRRVIQSQYTCIVEKQ